MKSPIRLAIFATHPIHYQAQLFRHLSQRPELEVTVLFGSRFGLSPQVDHTFGRRVQWYDASILQGYRHKFLTNLFGSRPPASIVGTLCPGVWSEVRSGRYDALLIQGYSGATEWIAMMAAKQRGCPVLFRGETALPPPSHSSHRFLRRRVLRMLSQLVDIFLPIGTRSREFYLRYGIDPGRLVLSPYAVDNDFLFAQAQGLKERREGLRRELEIPMDLPVVLCVAKMTPRKRSGDLLGAFQRIHAPAFLLLVGEGPLRASLEREIAAKGLRHVRMEGFKAPHEICRFYAVSDLFVLPSEYEPWGLVINEAMCFGLPVVTTSGVCSSADLVKDKENGFVVQAGDIGELAHALENLLISSQRRAAMGQRSRQIIQDWGLQASVQGICEGLRQAFSR